MNWQWKDVKPGVRVEKIRGKNKGARGTISQDFSPSGTFHVHYDSGGTGTFCKPENYKKLQPTKQPL